MEYSTGQVARVMGVHANTVRMYEQEGFIAPARRLENGYRRFDDEHLVQFFIARRAFRAEILQNGLRKDAVCREVQYYQHLRLQDRLQELHLCVRNQ